MSLEDLIYGERQEERAKALELAAQNLSKNLHISIEEARKLLAPRPSAVAVPQGATEDTAESPIASTGAFAPSSASVPGVSRMDLGAGSKPKTDYIGDIHTGDMRMDVANRLRWLRNHSGMLRDVILNNLGVSKETLDKIEGGQQEPTDTQLIILADLYGIKVADILRQ